MTVMIVFGNTTDAHVTSTNATYTTARNGGTLAVVTGSTFLAGQNTGYVHYQGFIGFTFTAITDPVVSAVVRLHVSSVATSSQARDLELRQFAWGSGGVTTADFRNATNLAACPIMGEIWGANASAGKKVFTGSDELRALLEAGTTPLELVVHTDRQRQGTVPTANETMTFVSADGAGTTDDPCLIVTTVPRTKIYGILGAHTRLADGTSVYLESDGASTPTISLKHRDHGATVTTIGGALSLGTGAGNFAVPTGMQGLALAVGADDSLYVCGRQGNAENTIRVRTYPRSGATWAAGTDQTFALPGHDAAANQVAACTLVSHGLESLVVFAAHTAGVGAAAAQADIAYLILNTTTLKANSGTHLRGSASAVGTTFPAALATADFSGFVNEVGTMLDLVADPGTAGQAYAISAERDQTPGSNAPVAVARLKLASDHATWAENSNVVGAAYLEKNASGKARLVPVGPQVVAAVTADAETGYGLSVAIEQWPSSGGPSVNLGYVALGEQGIASVPDGPAVAASAAWDALYSTPGGEVWIYYVDVANPLRVLRTSVDMSTYQATGTVVEVWVAPAGSTVTGIRVARNGHGGNLTLVTIAYTDGSAVAQFTGIQDSYNIAPLMPTLTARPGFDADLSTVFEWTFNDPNPGDAQSAYQLQVEDQSSGVTVYDSTKTASTDSAHGLLAGTLVNGETYRWRVRAWDALDAVSPWSDWGTTQTAAGGTVTVTLPATDNAAGITTDEVEVRWSTSGTTQTEYRLWLYRTGFPDVEVADTGWVASVADALLVSGFVSDVEHRVDVQVRNAVGVVSNTGSRLITPSFGRPEAPEVTVTPVSDGGYILVQVHNPLPGEPGAGLPLEGFESGIPAGWDTAGAVTVASTEQAHEGTTAAKMTASGGGNATLRAPAGTITAGQRYTARAWVYRPVAGAVTASIDWYLPGAVYDSTSQFATELAAGTWTEIIASGTAPDDAVAARYGVTLTGPPADGTVVYADEVILTVASDRPDVAINYIYRRPQGGTEWLLLGQTGPEGEYRDYAAASRTPYEYMVRGVSA